MGIFRIYYKFTPRRAGKSFVWRITNFHKLARVGNLGRNNRNKIKNLLLLDCTSYPAIRGVFFSKIEFKIPATHKIIMEFTLMYNSINDT